MNEEPTTASILTGSGRGAVGVVQITGPKALEVASELFQANRGQSLKDGPLGRPRFGRFAGDEVVAVVRESDVEIHGHGGVAVLEAMLSSLAGHGVYQDLNSQPHNEAEKATELLIRAETLRVAGILLDQSDGALDREINAIRQIENQDEARDRIQVLLDRAECGLRLESGWKIALTGRPNVGKSRLLNALAGFDRAIVSPQPGTTRDVVKLRASIDGWPVEIADTAGIRPDTQGLESAGIERAWQATFEADLVVVVLDRSCPFTKEDHAVIEAHPQALRVANKSDLPEAWSENDHAVMAISAETGAGLEALMENISRRLVPLPPSIGEAVPFLEEQVAMLRAMLLELHPSYRGVAR